MISRPAKYRAGTRKRSGAMSVRTTTKYFVNAEVQTTDEHKLTVRQILENAGFTPAEQYELIRDQGHHKYPNLDEEVPLRQGEHFTAKFVGVTPVS
jgi:hypothetical protein